MIKCLKTFKTYPAGTIVVGKCYSLWERFVNWIKHNQRLYNRMHILSEDSNIVVGKWNIIKNDYYLFIPIKPYTKEEMERLKTINKSCLTTDDYVAAVNIIRPGTIDISKTLEQLDYNKDYKRIFLDEEPLFDFDPR